MKKEEGQERKFIHELSLISLQFFLWKSKCFFNN